MASMEQRVVLCAALLAVILVIGASATSLVVGRRQYGDALVHGEQVNVRAKYNGVVTERRSVSVGRGNITLIRATDRGVYGRGGYAQVGSGGLGKNYVGLMFWSQKGQPLNFTLDVYARK